MRYPEESKLSRNVQTEFANLVELLCTRADKNPKQDAYLFLADGETESGRLTYADLDRRARAIAARLQSMNLAGERALLLYPPGFDYIEAFFGCLYAGVIAVPAYPPARQHLPRLQSIMRDASPAVIMTTAELAAKFRDDFTGRDFGASEQVSPQHWLATDTVMSHDASRWYAPTLTPQSLAFLQYTSGSTGDPKGVMVSHGNLLANQKAIRQGFGHTEHSTVVGWLPLYHDMGLIGNILQPLYVGSSAILMPPMAFLEKPVRWLKAISEHRAATSGGPNFAYDLCVRKVTADQKRELDLSCWTLAFNGSEPVRAATLERFSKAFAECGFRRESFFPCYGLAEATLFVTGARLEAGGSRLKEKFDRTDLDDSSSLGSPVSSLVSCGFAADGHTVRIVDPATGSLCPRGQEGEIWVSGPSVAQGYWNRPEESENTFRARLEAVDHSPQTTRIRSLASGLKPEVSFLRTGDLGMLDNGRLYVTGRIKDLIIIRGRNVYPQDIEHVLTDTEENLRPGGCVAFSVTHEDEEHLVVVAELSREAIRQADYEAVFASMRRTLAEACELTASELVLVPPGGVPKTSSGKLRRQACKDAYLEGRLPIVAKSGDGAWANTDTISFPKEVDRGEGLPKSNGHTEAPQQLHRFLREALFAVPQPQRAPLIAGFLRGEISRLLKITESAVSMESPLRSCGLDSLKAVELKHTVDNLLGIEAPLTLFLSDRSVTEVAEALAGQAEGLRLEAVGNEKEQAIVSVSSSLESLASSLSSTQLAMWAMQHMEPDSIVYNLHLALRIENGADAESLRRSFDRLAERHEMLRTVYRMEGDEVVQCVLPLSDLPDFFTVVDVSSWSEAELQDDMARRIREPFDLERGPVFRAVLYRHGTKTPDFRLKTSDVQEPIAHSLGTQASPHTLLLCAHHIALDLWSVLILVDELKQIHSEPVARTEHSVIREGQGSISLDYAGASSRLRQERRSSSRVYTGGEQDLNRPPASTYAAFVAWQRNYLQSPGAESDWDYWRGQLAGELPILALPTDHPRPVVPGYCGASVVIRLSRDETSRLKELVGRSRVTLFTVLLAAYKVLLHRYTHQTDLIVGVPIAGRNQVRFASVVGNFVNPVPLRSYPAKDKPFSSYLAEVHDALVGALEHQDYPFSLMVERLNVPRNADHWPVYQTLFVLQQAQTGVGSELAQIALGEDGETLIGGYWPVHSLAIRERVENFDLKLMAAECDEELLFSFQYRSDLFEPATIARLAHHFENLLRSIAADPLTSIGDLPLLSESERQRMLVEWNATANPSFRSQTSTLSRLFEVQAEKTPEATAVIFGNRQLTYRELNACSNRLAHALIAAGIAPDTPVGICARRSPEMVIGLLGILKAGGAYLPLDPDYPGERLSGMLSDAKVSLILVQPEFMREFRAFAGTLVTLDAELAGFADAPQHNPDLPVDEEMLAYVLFTSGSTGRPKGVGIPHKAVRNRLLWMQDYFGLDATDAVLQKTPFTFDVSVWEFFWPLIAGSRLIVAAPGDHREPERLVDLIERHSVTTLHFVPSMLGAFLELADFNRCASLRRVICSGEALTADLRKRFIEISAAELHNLYGPTEAAIDVTAWDCGRNRADPTVLIGRPIANTEVYLLDDRLNPVPVGVAGELYIGGIQLARGYLNRPDLTADRFVPNPFVRRENRGLRPEASGSREFPSRALRLTPQVSGRLYRTGDLARYRSDGTIEYLGRIDHQVKIRGFRIELGEIEARLRQHPAINDAVVAVRGENADERQIVAYWTSAREPAPPAEALQTFLKEVLPAYMIPAAFMRLDRFPVTANGKLDRRALPVPDLGQQLADQYVAPRNPAEECLANIWANLLGVERVGIHDNFFALGGDSILAIQAAGRARQAGIAFTPRQLFEHQTVAELAAMASRTSEEVESAEPVDGDLPLTPIQLWFVEQGFSRADHWNQALLLEIDAGLDWPMMIRAAEHLVVHHDALRLRLTREGQGWRQRIVPKETHAICHREDLSAVPRSEYAAALENACSRWQSDLNLSDGPLVRMVWFDMVEDLKPRLLIAIHHLAVDGVSWRILLEDLEKAYSQLARGEVVALPSKTSSYKRWAESLRTLAQSESLQQELGYWREATSDGDFGLPVDFPEGSRLEGDTARYRVELGEKETLALLREAPGAYRTGVEELLLAALAQILSAWRGGNTVTIDLESHGREAPFDDIDLSRTVGWFTSLYPVRLEIPQGSSEGVLIRTVKAQLARIPRKGLGYGLLRYLQDSESPSRLPILSSAQILFNYLGQFDQIMAKAPWTLASEAPGRFRHPRNKRAYELEVEAHVSRGRLMVEWRYSAGRFRQETIAALAESFLHTLKGLIGHCLSPEAGAITPGDFPLAGLSQEALDAQPYDRREIGDIFPLSPMQEGMLFETLMAPHSGIYVMQDRFELRGTVDENLFRRAWQSIVDRHDALRTGFLWETSSRPYQVVLRRVELPFEYYDWRTLSAVEQEARLDALLANERQRGFDFHKPPLMTIRLFRVGENHYRFVRSFHHILIDAWCMSLMLVEMRDTYQALCRGEVPDLAPPPQFREYIAWLQSRDDQSAERFWRSYLQGFTEATPFNVDHPANADDDQEVGDAIVFLSEQETAMLNAQAQRYRLTPNTFVQAAWALMLSRYSGRKEVLFGVTVSGRPAELPDSERILGVFINTLPLRIAVPAHQSLPEFLQTLFARNAEIRQYEHVPLVQIQSWSEIPREQPLFESLLVFENYPVDPSLRMDQGAFGIVGVETRTHTGYPLTGMAIPGDRLHLQMTYYRSRFSGAVVENMLAHFRNLLVEMIRSPEKRLGQLEMLGEEELRQILVGWNRTERHYPGAATFVGRFTEQAKRTPEAPAVACGDAMLSYGELNQRSERMASALIARGVGPEDIVVLLADRSVDFLVAFLAILKAGAVYLPLDPAQLDVRLTQVLQASDPVLVIVGKNYEGKVQEAANGAWATVTPETLVREGSDGHPGSVRIKPDNLAYMIYTSGSTGEPKGVMVEQAGMLNNLLTKIPALGIDTGDVIAQTASQSFDISVWQFLTPLLCGARVAIYPDEIAHDPKALLEAVARDGVTVLESVPALIRGMLDGPKVDLSRLRWLMPTGEVFPADLCWRWMERYPHVRLLNAYGPAECSDDVAYHPISVKPAPEDYAIPIGRPVDNLKLYILDSHLHSVPVGVPGELYIAGIGVGRGYLNDPRLTASTFVPNPFLQLSLSLGEGRGECSRLYRTGDLARFRPDGTIDFLGRVDHQVKIRGHRIELGEIEAHLLKFPQVRDAVVAVREIRSADKVLVAYVVPRTANESETPLVDALRGYLRGALPGYMVPAAFVILETLPLTSNGKVDRKRLPAPDFTGSSTSVPTLPRNPTEAVLLDIWRTVLETDRLGVYDNFFELGGHSLLAIQLATKVRAAFGVDVPLRKLFEAPTIAQLAKLVEDLLLATLEELSEDEAEAQLTNSDGVLPLRSGRHDFADWENGR